MTKTTEVSGHTRRLVKPDAYIATHMALFSRRSDALRFAHRHGVPVVTEDEPQSKQERFIYQFRPWFWRIK